MPGASALLWELDPRLDERSVFLFTFGKKILRISGEDPFFFGLQLHLARYKCSKIRRNGQYKANVNVEMVNINAMIPTFSVVS